MNNMCVIGWGTVGRATAKTFTIDRYYSRSSQTITLEEAAKSDVIFICLPTPVNQKGEYQTHAIEDLIGKLSAYYEFGYATVVIRSTVYPGFARHLQRTFGLKQVVSNPEFLSEDTWEEDALKPQLVVIGSDDPESREKIKGLYQGRFKYNEPIVTDSVTAELLKLTFNAFFTTKVVFANAIASYAGKLGANYETIKQTLLAHPWGSKHHFTVFDKGGNGAGGKCLRKDIKALSHYSKQPLFETIMSINEELLIKSGKA